MSTSNWDRLCKEILETDLYTRSGTEVGVSQGTLRLSERDGDYFPEKVAEGDIPDICLEASSDAVINYPKLNQAIFGQLPSNWLIGNYKKIFIGHAKDEGIRRNAASGGIISGALTYLLESGKIDGAVSLRMSKDKPYLTEPFIARTRTDVLEGAQSKYTTAPLNHILADLPQDQRIAYVGLPEEVASVRKLQQLNWPGIKPVHYVFGSFYGEAIGFSAVKSFLRAHGVKDLSELKSLAFRAGEWPGHMRIELHSGRVISVRKFHANYLIPSHITKYSLYQVDYTSELADISVGDAWAPTYEQRGGGWSAIIARSDKGMELLDEMRRQGLLELKEISEAEFLKMHSHGLDFKKRGAFIRIDHRKAKGLPVPEYGYRPVNIPAGRDRFERFLSMLFVIFQWPLTIWVLEHLPTSFIGWFFIQARTIWKRRTKSAKGGGLEELRFTVYDLPNL